MKTKACYCYQLQQGSPKCDYCQSLPPGMQSPPPPSLQDTKESETLHDIIVGLLAKWEKDDISVAEIGLDVSKFIRHQYAEELIEEIKKMKLKGDFAPKGVMALLGMTEEDVTHDAAIHDKALQKVLSLLERKGEKV